jgi:hypothetical protein
LEPLPDAGLALRASEVKLELFAVEQKQEKKVLVRRTEAVEHAETGDGIEAGGQGSTLPTVA